jgi:hypothetical protein
MKAGTYAPQDENPLAIAQRVVPERTSLGMRQVSKRSLSPTAGIAELSSVGRAAWLLVVLLLSAASGLAHAQAGNSNGNGKPSKKSSASKPLLPSAALLSTAGATAAGTPLDSVIQAALEELGVVRVVSRPGMDLGAVQLALDCVGETAACLKSVTEQNAAEVLIAPTLQSTPSELVLSLLRFDSRGDGSMRRVLRRQAGRAVGAELLDAVPDMLRELFDLPKREPAPVAAAPTKAPASASEAPAPDASASTLADGPMEPPDSARRVPVGPIILAGAGVALLAAGGVVGLVMQSKQSEYEGLPTGTKAEADIAIHTRSVGQTQAAVADVLFAVGGAAVVAGGIWLAVELSHKSHYESGPESAFAPIVGPHQLGLVWMQRGGGL